MKRQKRRKIKEPRPGAELLLLAVLGLAIQSSLLAGNAPQLMNAPASGIGATLAILNGQMLSTGGEPTDVILYYGTADGGTNAASWAHGVLLGAQTATYEQTVLGLASNTTYYFTAEATNGGGSAWAVPSQSFTTGGTNPVSMSVAMLTYHNDNSRQGVNSNETILTLANVNTNTFGRLFSYTVDGYVYAQPLVMTNVAILGKGTHNIVFVVTENDSVYALDADSNQGANAAPLWQTSFLYPAAGVTAVPDALVGNNNVLPVIGITETPVIDPVSGTLYVETKTEEVTGGVTNYVHRLHALDITSGLERTSGLVSNSPAIVAATNYPGTGAGTNDTDGHGHVLWNDLRELCRPALTLYNGVIYLAYGSHGDIKPYHGWLFAYDAHSLAQLSVYNSTPNGTEGAFWQGGGGATVDAQGYIYFQTGNGTFDAQGATFSQATNDFAMSVLKFAVTNGLELVDYFAPSNAVALSSIDQDLGASGTILLPDSAGSAEHPHLILGGGKTAPIYLMDRDNLGKFDCTNCNNNIVQQFNGGPTGDRDTTPAFFGNTVYIMGQNKYISAFTIDDGIFDTNAVQTPDTYDNKGGATVCISANGTKDAIAWAVESNGGNNPTNPCILRAYNAANIAHELYTSDALPSRDTADIGVKFIAPTIVNGKVYIGAQYALDIYGRMGGAVANPAISPAGGPFLSSVWVTLSDATSGTTPYYTLDGTSPTTNSLLYTIPFCLTNTTVVQAIAVAPGAMNSGIADAAFVNTPSMDGGNFMFGAPFLATNGFQVQFSAPTGQTYVFQASTNLMNWVSVGTTVPSASPFYMVDPSASNFPARFYRVMLAP